MTCMMWILSCEKYVTELFDNPKFGNMKQLKYVTFDHTLHESFFNLIVGSTEINIQYRVYHLLY